MSDDEEDEDDLLVGLSRPKLNAAPAEEEDDDDEEEEGEAVPAAPPPTAPADEEESDDEEETGGLLGAEAAFAEGAAPLELDPFRIVAGADIAAPAETSAGGKKAKAGAQIAGRIYVNNLPHTLDDAGLVKFFARYGKVLEATVVKGDRGNSRGFGFVSFVSDKGARFCIKEAGDPPKLDIGGRSCNVRYAEQKDDHGARQHKMPARGNVDYLGLNFKKNAGGREAGSSSSSRPQGGDEMSAPGVAMIAAAHKRALPPGAPHGGDRESKRKSKEPKQPSGEEKGIVTVSRRQDAEPLNKQPITMREIFPKEFWRI